MIKNNLYLKYWLLIVYVIFLYFMLVVTGRRVNSELGYLIFITIFAPE